jgi:hypothetical protein
MVNLQAGSGETVIIDETFADPSVSVDDYRVVTGTPVLRGANGLSVNKTTFLANGTDYVRVSPVPSGAIIDVITPSDSDLENIMGITMDGTSNFEIDTLVKGTYKIIIKNIVVSGTLRLDYEVTVNAN